MTNLWDVVCYVMLKIKFKKHTRLDLEGTNSDRLEDFWPDLSYSVRILKDENNRVDVQFVEPFVGMVCTRIGKSSFEILP